MAEHNNLKFYLRIGIPSVLAILLFVLSLLTFVIPAFERNMLERKKEMIKELTQTAWSVLDEYNSLVEEDSICLEDAKNQAASIIELLRYGEDRKDYFWIIDMWPNMIMHPYRPELNGSDLRNYQDPEGKLLFVEAVNVVKESNEGYISYIWQWKDDSTRLVPKLSFVKAYSDWNWIIGTGIYLKDVEEEISILKNRLLRISLIIIVVISITLFYIVRQTIFTEWNRKKAEDSLKLSRLKYKSLVEASTEGTIMIINDKVIFANLKLQQMIGFEMQELMGKGFDDIFETEWKEVGLKFKDPNKTISLETGMKCKNQKICGVVISISKIKYGEEEGFIVITKDVTRQKRLQIESSNLSQELEMSLLLMNQPIKPFVKELICCEPDMSVGTAAELMNRKNQNAVFVKFQNEIIGILTDKDLRTRVTGRKLPYTTKVSVIMTSPVASIQEDAVLYEVLLVFKTNNISHVLVKNVKDEDIGILSYQDVLSIQHNSVSLTVKEIETAENLEALVKIGNRTPVLVNALLEAGDKTSNITRVITSISDALTVRIIKLAIEKTGSPPCPFAFVALGSEGRKEQTLLTDQDNAIIFEDVSSEKIDMAQDYFLRLAKQINQDLDVIGFKFCKGDIMAMNPKWTKPVSVWKSYFTDWIDSSDPQNILDSSIFFDLRCVYGSCNFVEQLLNYIHNYAENKAVFFQHMANPLIRYRSKISFFGGIVGDQDSGESKKIDIKKIQFPIVGFARIYAIKYKVIETNTLKRIEKLFKIGVIQKDLYDELTVAYSVLMQLRLRFQADAELQNRKPDNMVDISQLTTIEVSTLKKILSELNNIQAKLSFDFKGTV